MISGKRIASLLWHAAAARPAAASSVSFGIIARRAPAINGRKNNSARMLARCSVPAHYASLRVLATSALRASDGQRPGRECIFLRKCKHLLPKNTRNDVHAVISD